MEIVLIPGLWLDGSTWDDVVPVLRQSGHTTHALTLPGMESKEADRSQVTLRDHIDAVIELVDSFDSSRAEVVLVGHSKGGAIAYAALDARPDRIARIVYVDSWPPVPGGSGIDGLPADGGDVVLPDWSVFDQEDLVDLDDELRAAFRERAIPSPVRVVRDSVQLSDERRYDVPATLIACEFTSSTLRGWVAEGELPELARIRDVEYIDLPTGHWPQFTRPGDLGRAILASVSRSASASE